MMVSDVMTREVYMAEQTDSVRDVLEKFATYRIGGMPIVDAEHRIVGYISDGDLMRHLGRSTNSDISYFTFAMAFPGYFDGLAAVNTETDDMDELRRNVTEICHKNAMEVGVKRVITVTAVDDLVQVSAILAQRKIKKVPVIDENRKVIGIVSRGDVVRAVVRTFLALT